MTSLCPDRCNHSKDVALFRDTLIAQYLSYEKIGKWADEKQEEIFYTFPSEGESEDDDSDWQPKAFAAKIKNLKVGDSVILAYEHRKMTPAGGGSWGVRPFVHLELA